jgi:hypothetical protein
VKLEPETIVRGLMRLVDASPAGLEGVQVTDLELGVTAATVDGIQLQFLGRLVVDVRDWAAGGFAGPDLALRGTIRDGDGRHVVCGSARVVWCADWCSLPCRGRPVMIDRILTPTYTSCSRAG